jgi:hypothetical protein
VQRFVSRTSALALLAFLLNGCATYAPRPTNNAAPHDLPEATASGVIAEWQRRLGQHVADAGSGDPAVLAQLPSLRSSAVMRPGQIVFAATDVESFVAERDGFDVFGLLVGKQDGAAGPRYVFIVGTVERRNYRSVAVADMRLTAMSVRNGIANWETGAADGQALDRYRNNGDTTAAVRFPADRDQFRLTACPPGVCVEEIASGARWSIYLNTSVAGAPAASPVSRP